MKKLSFLLLVAGLILSLTSCNNEDNLDQKTPVDVVLSVKLPGVQTRAAMGELQKIVDGNEAATVTKIHVYLLASNGDIKENKEFTPADATAYNALTSTTPVTQPTTSGGYKFTNVDKSVTKALVIVNPQGDIVTSGNISKVTGQMIKAQVNQVIYAAQKDLESAGLEPYGPNASDTEKRVVKKAELTIRASMNRFQVLGTKFTKVRWKTGKYDQAKGEVQTYVNGGATNEAAWEKFKATELDGEVWDGKSDPTALTHWSTYFEVINVTAANTGILMNRFSNTFAVPSFEVEDEANWSWAKTYADGRYNPDNGTFIPNADGKDKSDVASYYSAGGFNFEDGKKAAAFNFFVNKITGYGTDGNAPKIAFVFKTAENYASNDGVAATRRFLVIKGYTDTEGADTASSQIKTKKDERGGQLINLDLAKLNKEFGIVVDVDPTIPGGVTPDPEGGDDLENENVNVIVRVTVEDWTAVNVFPIF